MMGSRMRSARDGVHRRRGIRHAGPPLRPHDASHPASRRPRGTARAEARRPPAAICQLCAHWADSVGTLAHLFSTCTGPRAHRGRAPIIRRLPSAAMGRNPLAGSAHVPACNQSISPTGRGRSQRPGSEGERCACRSAGLPRVLAGRGRVRRSIALAGRGPDVIEH